MSRAWRMFWSGALAIDVIIVASCVAEHRVLPAAFFGFLIAVAAWFLSEHESE